MHAAIVPVNRRRSSIVEQAINNEREQNDEDESMPGTPPP